MSVVHRERSYWSCYGLWSLQETTILTLVEGTTLGAILWPMAYMNTNYTHHNNYMVNGYDCWCIFIWWSPLYRGKHQNIYFLWHFYVRWVIYIASYGHHSDINTKQYETIRFNISLDWLFVSIKGSEVVGYHRAKVLVNDNDWNTILWQEINTSSNTQFVWNTYNKGQQKDQTIY